MLGKQREKKECGPELRLGEGLRTPAPFLRPVTTSVVVPPLNENSWERKHNREGREDGRARGRVKEEVYHRLLEVALIVDVVHFVGARLVEVSVIVQCGDAQTLLLLPTRSFDHLQGRKPSA